MQTPTTIGSRTLGFVLGISVAVLWPSASLDASVVPSFQGLGNLLGGGGGSSANGISANGLVVVGASSSALGGQAFRWTAGDGMVGLGDLPFDGFRSVANGVSADGSVVVGQGSSISGREAFRWTAASGMVRLGFLPGSFGTGSHALAVSGDGSVVVGRSSSAAFPDREAFRWTAASGMVGLGDLQGPFNLSSEAFAISGDGSVIVGSATSSNALPSEAFRWTAADGMVGIGDLAGGVTNSRADGVSFDGSVVVGLGDWSSDTGEAYRWTASTGMIGLGDLPGGQFFSQALATSNDGSVVVGVGNLGSGSSIGTDAFIWNAADGMRSLHDALINDFGLSLGGFTRLIRANDISGDGRTIVGQGINASGNVEAFIATVPEPTTLSLLAFGGLLLLRRRRQIAQGHVRGSSRKPATKANQTQSKNSGSQQVAARGMASVGHALGCLDADARLGNGVFAPQLGDDPRKGLGLRG